MPDMPDSIGRRAAVAAIRRLGAHVPGWFPLVAERLHPYVKPPADTVTVSVNGYRLRLDTREYLQRSMYYGCHEPEEVRLFKRLVRPGDVVVDIGAHVGYFTLLAATLAGPAGRVFAFEPIPTSYEQLAANVRSNALRNVVVEQAAVSDQPGKLSLGLTDESVEMGASDYTAGGPPRRGDGAGGDDRRVSRRARLGPSVRLVKLDVEGLETQVLAGMRELPSANPPDALMLEYNAAMFARHGHDGAALLDGLRQAGFRLYSPETFGRVARRSMTPLPVEPLPPSSPDRSVVETLRAGLATRRTALQRAGAPRRCQPAMRSGCCLRRWLL